MLDLSPRERLLRAVPAWARVALQRSVSAQQEDFLGRNTRRYMSKGLHLETETGSRNYSELSSLSLLFFCPWLSELGVLWGFFSSEMMLTFKQISWGHPGEVLRLSGR